MELTPVLPIPFKIHHEQRADKVHRPQWEVGHWTNEDGWSEETEETQQNREGEWIIPMTHDPRGLTGNVYNSHA